MERKGNIGNQNEPCINTDFIPYSHKSAMVRKTTSVFLDAVVERMGPGRILSGVKDVTDKILPVTAQLALDNGQETRSDITIKYCIFNVKIQLQIAEILRYC